MQSILNQLPTPGLALVWLTHLARLHKTYIILTFYHNNHFSGIKSKKDTFKFFNEVLLTLLFNKKTELPTQKKRTVQLIKGLFITYNKNLLDITLFSNL